MPSLTTAPGAPGMRPTWTSSAKDVVTTALGTSRVWVTIGYGILNEVYWPATGRPQLRDLGFIVAGPKGWTEVKRAQRYTISTPDPRIPLPRIVHIGDGYELVLEVAPDPLRDAVQISYQLFGEGCTLYALLAPHVGNSGEGNNAQAGQELTAWKDNNAQCLVSDCGFSRTSAGYVGASDGWQDFNRNGRMTWTYDLAIDGNVALLGELRKPAGALAIGFSGTRDGARTLAISSLSEGFVRVRQRFIDEWRTWGDTVSVPSAEPELERQAYISAVVLKVHEDRTFPGSTVASLSVPWGNANDSSGGYHLVWPRDCVEAGLALIGGDRLEEARNMLGYLIATQRADGHWSQNTFPDGHAFWSGIQLDEVGFPVILAAKLAECDPSHASISGAAAMTRAAVNFLVQNGPISDQDRWEENPGASPFTLATEIAALVASAEIFDDQHDQHYVLSLADYWNERIEDWCYTADGPLAAQFGVHGYYVRIAPSPAAGGLQGCVQVHNRSGQSVPAVAMVGMEYLHLVRMGLRDPSDPRIQDTLKITEALLGVETPNGVAYHRYNEDGYGEKADGSPFDGSGIGRLWPLLSGERGHYELMRGGDPLPYLRAMARMTGPGGLIPEQVWDGPPIPDRWLLPGKPTGSAMPLVWAHAEFLKLLCAREQGRPLEMLTSVQRHFAAKPAADAAWHWRTDINFTAMPDDRDLLIDCASPFTLHVGFDGWQDVGDRASAPLAFGRHGVRLTQAELRRHKVVDFTLFLVDEGRWIENDHHVRLTPVKKHAGDRKNVHQRTS